MAVNAGQLHGPSFTSGTVNIDTVLTQEAYRIGRDIHRKIVHTTPWIDLIRKTSFPEGMGYLLGTLIYDRVLPTSDEAGNTLGVTWQNVGDNAQDTFTERIGATTGSEASTLDQILAGARDTNIGAQDGRHYVHFARNLKQYQLKRAVVESPRISVDDLRFAAHRQEQLRAAVNAMSDSTRYTWEERNRDEFDRLCANLVTCGDGTPQSTTFHTQDQAGTPVLVEGTATTGLDIAGVSDYTPDANISNFVMDSVYYRLVRAGAGNNAYGRENGRPVFAVVMSSEASYRIMTESGFRDDVRYNKSRVGDLIAPLGVERSFRGFYHLIDDLAPRFSITGGVPTRIQPYTSASGVVTQNTAYDTAQYEMAYVLHPDVFECSIPTPISGSQGLQFDPQSYSGEFNWRNIQDEVLNPDKTIGFFRGVMASASKPIRTEFGYAILFDCTSSTSAV